MIISEEYVRIFAYCSSAFGVNRKKLKLITSSIWLPISRNSNNFVSENEAFDQSVNYHGARSGVKYFLLN